MNEIKIMHMKTLFSRTALFREKSIKHLIADKRFVFRLRSY